MFFYRSLLVLILSTGIGMAQENTSVLYICKSETSASVVIIGLTLCTATSTNELSLLSEERNLQIREGVLIVKIEPNSISEQAGLQQGDMIYRIGSSDIIELQTAADRLAGVRRNSDTVVNFLRRGRPYRIKFRLN
jgi:C-terminal processing protease CtpA/Prc